MKATTIEARAARHAALGDPVRLRIVDDLVTSDLSPVELRDRLGIESNLLAHHLDLLESAGLIQRSRSSGDGRRRYVHLIAGQLDELTAVDRVQPGPALFVCTHNSARSQLAAALWHQVTGCPAESAGTHPAAAVHREAAAAARRAAIDLGSAAPKHLDDLVSTPDLVVTVCDRAHEELTPNRSWLHWSIPDPVVAATPAAFDAVVSELTERMTMYAMAAA